MTDPKLNFVQHHDDEGLDEIVFIVDRDPFIRCVMVPRYKTSGLSGDEWRVSAMWERQEGGLWVPFDGPYRNITTAAHALFPGVFNSHKDWHQLNCTSVRLLRKRRPIIEMTHDGRPLPLPLLVAIGHLPWTLEIWPEQLPPEAPAYFGGAVTQDLCFQVGCAEGAVSTYTLKKRHRRDGSEYSAERHHWGRDAIRFCPKHLRRGDCGLEDADRNYEVVEGPGPDKHATDVGDVSPSRLVTMKEA